MDDKMKKKVKQQLVSLQEEIYKDIPSGFNFKVIMENIEGFLEDRPDLKASCEEIWELYNAAKDCATEDGEPYKDFNDYTCKDLREGNIRDRILGQILTISYKLKIELKDMSLDIITKTKKNKLYFMLRYVYNDLCLPSVSFVRPDGEWVPVDLIYIDLLKRVFEQLEGYEIVSMINDLFGGMKYKDPISIDNNEFVSAICKAPNFPCIEMNVIKTFEKHIKAMIEEESNISLINAATGVLDIMRYGKYNINGVSGMIELWDDDVK